ncbi:Spy/CpxP family protein refolding chaperone [candidate division KSB1 bacterium]|nr:Spy/CpxP family protein refolding chaperone [candidate division KSB1 bacterium]NIR70050.1 Spy/CpxP family protein refolding chaperone [candidate division KSB1 bacterium]NIS23044.1 Spy/CpxP family protein refolding chaperone [candidate division KSB1 bacterium]NIT69897.1 Spy/CpxP family protein refolding chaperone [candidate division KSB1 bacterium]NIU23562.1 Spy/CpxP family protein refolding chaperone [candidate division KSB1 bacterium]
MKTRKLTSVLILLLIATVIVTSEALAQPFFNRHHSRILKLEMLADELELTEDQRAQIKEQRFATQTSAIETRSKIQIAELELQKLMHEENVDENKVKSKVQEIGKLKTELRWNRVHGRLSMQEILTPEQKEKLKSVLPEHLQERQDRGRSFRHLRRFRHFRDGDGDFGPGRFNVQPEEPFDEEMDF